MKRYYSLFQTKLLMAFLLCTLIPLSILSYVSYSVSRSIAWNKTMDASLLAADQLHVQLSARIHQAENVADTLQYNMYALSQDKHMDFFAHLDAITLLRTNISLYLSTFDFHQICVFLHDDDFGSEEGLYFYPLSALKSFSVTPADLETLGASSLWVYRSQIETPFILHPSKPKTDSVICCRALFNQGRQQLDYAYFIIMDTAEFSDMLISSYLNTEISGYLVLPDGMVIASSKPESCNQILPQELMQNIAECTESYF